MDLSRESSFEWKTIYNYIIGGLVACLLGVVTLYYNGINSNTIEIPETDTYEFVVQSIHDTQNPQEVLDALNSLVSNGDADATYLLSRLYFRSRMQDDYCPDSIRTMQQNLNVQCDNIKAHQLLQKAIDLNPKNYPALYELACDYWKADQRTEAVSSRNGDKAEQYFNLARTYAVEANDSLYLRMTDVYLADIKKWREYIKEMNSK